MHSLTSGVALQPVERAVSLHLLVFGFRCRLELCVKRDKILE